MSTSKCRKQYLLQWMRDYRTKVKKGDFPGVYLLGCSAFGWYKIGCAKWVKLRIAQLQHILPFELDTIVVWHHLNPRTPEAFLHQTFKKHRIRSEWFSFINDPTALIEAHFDARYVTHQTLRPRKVSIEAKDLPQLPDYEQTSLFS